ncbi:MAG: glycosyl hydrolase 115 family protein, partial [Ruminiclostridium sp.]|nr:glycosyl hydrolase 115 family protein [Ruminiclostridium sp.]
KGSTLKDNIDLLKKVIRTQNELIKKIINPDLDKVPRQMVLFSEVEEFFYGSDENAGLIDDPDLSGVTIMLSDNNHGSTRTLPTEKMRSHKGGFGMYYHQDMHGGAYSYQWIGATYLPKLWEQMTMAYDFGVREMWITNIGDIGTQEHGLAYFLDLAYDINKWGGRDAAVTLKYTEEWLRTNFGGIFDDGELAELGKAYNEHLVLLARRRHEVMNDKVYHPVHFGEAQDVLDACEHITAVCDSLREKCPENMEGAYVSLIYYPLCATANLMKMWILSGRNALYAYQNRTEANVIADEIEKCFIRDEELTREYHSVDGGKFSGFGLSEHIGFRSWNDEDYQYPVRRYVRPVNSPLMAAARVTDDEYMSGRYWTGRDQVWTDALRPDVSDIYFEIASRGNAPVKYSITTDCPWLSFSSVSGETSLTDMISLHIDRTKFDGAAEGSFTISYPCPVQNEADGIASVRVTVKADNCKELPADTFLETDGYVCMEASHFVRKHDAQNGAFEVLAPYGRTGSAIKAYPVTVDFTAEQEKPYTEYDFIVREGGSYIVRFYMQASTPVINRPEQYISFSVNGGEITTVNTVKNTSRPFVGSAQWSQEAFENIKLTEVRTTLVRGRNTMRIYAASQAMVFERVLVYRKDCPPPQSYLGPRESFRRS